MWETLEQDGLDVGIPSRIDDGFMREHGVGSTAHRPRQNLHEHANRCRTSSPENMYLGWQNSDSSIKHIVWAIPLLKLLDRVSRFAESKATSAQIMIYRELHSMFMAVEPFPANKAGTEPTPSVYCIFFGPTASRCTGCVAVRWEFEPSVHVLVRDDFISQICGSYLPDVARRRIDFSTWA